MPPPQTQHNQLLGLFNARGGLLTSAEIACAKLPGSAVTRLSERGLIERLQRGVYRLNDAADLPVVDAEAEELLTLQLRYPHALPCLVSALHLHGLTTTRPRALQIAVPHNRRAPHSDQAALEVFYFSPKHYDHGQTKLSVGQRQLRLYSPEKTLCDLLRYAPKFGRDLYLEGLKKFVRGHATPQLIKAAKRAGVWKELGRDLEVLAHDQDA